ncbi:MAG: ABC transporter substrate-binding protein [Patescibacteria group bacterium]
MKKTPWIAVAIIIIILGAVLVSQKNKSTGPIKIGVATLLSGDYAILGDNIVKAAKLAAGEVNAKGGINGRMIELTIEDAGVDSKTGLSAAHKLIDIDGIRYIVGGMSSNGTIAAAPIANQSKAIIMTPVTGGSNVDNAGEYIFRTANADVLAGRDLANSMLKLGYTKVAVVSEVTEYTADIADTFKKTIAAGGGIVVASEEFKSNTNDYRTLVSKVQAAKPQALLVLSQTGTNAGKFIKQSRELSFNPVLFTDFNFATNDNAKQIVGTFDGIYFTDPSYDSESAATKAFFDSYQKTYGTTPAIPFHAAATYDGIMMFAEALKAVGDDSEKVKNWLLANIKNYQGLMGTYSLDEKGNSDIGFTLKVIKDGKPTPVQF